jgi:hypothetical protein
VKNLYNIYDSTKIIEQELPTIFCDMDQVLVDFLKGSEAVLGKPFNEIDKDKRWPKIGQKKDFWETLEWMPGGKRLWSFVNKYDAHILSAYSSKDSNSVPGKTKWLRRNAKLTQKSRIHLVQRADKQKFAMINNKPNVLIDDYAKNIKEWEAKGGIGIVHTNTGSTLNSLKKLGYK